MLVPETSRCVLHPLNLGIDRLAGSTRIVMTFPESLLIKADVLQRFRFTPCQASFDSPIHDSVDFVPTQSQILRYNLLAGHPQPIDRQTFKQHREPAPLLRPRQLYDFRPTLLTLAPRRIRVQDSLVLAGVQMTPCACGLMVVQVTQRAALNTWPLNANGMTQENVNLSLLQFQFHAFDIPRIGYPENLSIKLSVLNGYSPLGASPV